MFTGKLLRQALDKFMKGEVAANARVQVILPNGEFYDINGVKLLFFPRKPWVIRIEEIFS